jgi:hypothetical protein
LVRRFLQFFEGVAAPTDVGCFAGIIRRGNFGDVNAKVVTVVGEDVGHRISLVSAGQISLMTGAPCVTA